MPNPMFILPLINVSSHVFQRIHVEEFGGATMSSSLMGTPRFQVIVRLPGSYTATIIVFTSIGRLRIFTASCLVSSIFKGALFASWCLWGHWTASRKRVVPQQASPHISSFLFNLTVLVVDGRIPSFLSALIPSKGPQCDAQRFQEESIALHLCSTVIASPGAVMNQTTCRMLPRRVNVQGVDTAVTDRCGSEQLPLETV
ncbi:hypothetical protein BKA61DRAFT_23370 [Leptodontidium sp. MPI-SDFR-AT-0119]|nr:hypothetical protein BKA61DRAFT_23370 [Leptodontidium sp. MPI-SDFR-AT-0119]